MLRITFFALCLCSLVHLHAENAAPNLLKEPQLVEEEKGYEIELPENWRAEKNFMGVDVFASAPDLKETSLANISVISDAISDNISLDQYFAENVKELEKTLSNFHIIESGDASFEGVKGKKIAYTHALDKLKIKVIQYYVVNKGHCYIITTAADDQEFAKYADIFEKSVKSFKLL